MSDPEDYHEVLALGHRLAGIVDQYAIEGAQPASCQELGGDIQIWFDHSFTPEGFIRMCRRVAQEADARLEGRR